MKINVVTDYGGFLRLREQWNDLHRRSLHPLVFLTHEWIDTWWKTFGEGRELLILLLYEDNELIGIAPFMTCSGEHTIIGRTNTKVMARKIELIANVHSNRSDLILASDPAECCAAVVDFLLTGQPAWDLMSLKFMVSSSPSIAGLKRALGGRGLAYRQYPQMSSPYVPINCRWDNYFQSLDGRFRRNVTSRLRKLEKEGAVRLAVYRNATEVDEVMQQVFAVAEKSWKASQGTALSSTAESRGFYTEMARMAAEEKWLEIYVLYVGNTAVAFDYCLRFDNRLFLLKTEFDEDYRSFGVGNLLKLKQFEKIFASGIEEFDFLGPSMPWKKYWSNGHEREHIRLYAFNKSGKGRFLKLFYAAKDLARKLARI